MNHLINQTLKPEYWFSTDQARELFFTPEQREALAIYPSWVPTILLGELFGPHRDTNQILATHPKMEHVWKELHKLDTEKGTTKAMQLCFAVREALYTYNDSADALSPSQRAEKTEELLRSLITLSNDLDKFGVDIPILCLLTTEEQNELGLDKKNDSKVKILTSPMLNTLLKRMTQRLKKGPIGSNSLIQKQTKNNEIVHFIRYLGEHFQITYGKYLYGTICSLVNVFFDQELTRDFVLRCIKGTPTRTRQESLDTLLEFHGRYGEFPDKQDS